MKIGHFSTCQKFVKKKNTLIFQVPYESWRKGNLIILTSLLLRSKCLIELAFALAFTVVFGEHLLLRPLSAG